MLPQIFLKLENMFCTLKISNKSKYNQKQIYKVL